MKLQPRQKQMMNNSGTKLRLYGGGKGGGKSRSFLQKKPSRSLVNDYQLSWLYARQYCKENNIAFHSSRVKYLQGTTGLSKFIINYRRKEIVQILKPIFKNISLTAIRRFFIGLGSFAILELFKMISK